MVTVTHVFSIDYVAKLLDEDAELLQAIVRNDDNLSYGSSISVYTGPDDEAITSLTRDGMKSCSKCLSMLAAPPTNGATSSTPSSMTMNSSHASNRNLRGNNRAVTMRSNFVKDQHGTIRYERDNDWPYILNEISSNERVIYGADGKILILQHRHRRIKNGEWSKWVNVVREQSHAQMRKLLEHFHPFASDTEKLDAICLKTDDGDYIEHSR